MVEKKYIYQQYSLGDCKVIKTCGSLAITVKKDMVQKFNIQQGEEFLVVLLRRNTLSDELTKEEIKNIVTNEISDAQLDAIADRLRKNAQK